MHTATELRILFVLNFTPAVFVFLRSEDFNTAAAVLARRTGGTYLLNSARQKIRELHKIYILTLHSPSPPPPPLHIPLIHGVRRLSLRPLGTSETDVISSAPEAIRKYGIPAVINPHILQIENITIRRLCIGIVDVHRNTCVPAISSVARNST